MALGYYDYFFSEFPHRPLHVYRLIQLYSEWHQVQRPGYLKELKQRFSLFHPPEWAEKHFQTWMEALLTACLDPAILEEDFAKYGSKAVIAEVWSELYGPAKGPQAKKSCERWVKTLISILRDQDRLCLETNCDDDEEEYTLVVEIIEDEDKEVAIYDERASSRAAYGSVGARLRILKESSWKKASDEGQPLEKEPLENQSLEDQPMEDQPLEIVDPWKGHSNLPTPYMDRYQLPPHGSPEKHKTRYLGSGLWYNNAFFRDFPSRAITANNRAEIDEEWSKVQDPNYRNELRRIFNVFHVKWRLVYGKNLMADKHLNTWLKTLEYAHKNPENLEGKNDHSVRTGYVIRGGNVEPSVAPPDNFHYMKTYLLQVPDDEQEILSIDWEPALGIWAKRHGWNHGGLQISRGHHVEYFQAITTNGDGKTLVMSGSTYGLTYYDPFFAGFPWRALPIQRPPASIKILQQVAGTPLDQDWIHIRDSLRQEYNKIGNPHYRFVILSKFRQSHPKEEAKRHMWTWIKALTRAYHDSTSAHKFTEANWAVPFKWVVGGNSKIEAHYWIGVDGFQRARGRDDPEMLPWSTQLDQFYDNKWQLPSPQTWDAAETAAEQIKKPPYSGLQNPLSKRKKKPTYSERIAQAPKILEPSSLTGLRKPAVLEESDDEDTTVPDWEQPEHKVIDLLVEPFSLTFLDLPSPIRDKILKMVLIVKKPIRPRRCDQAIGKDFKPISRIDCPCRACCGTVVAQGDLRRIKSTYAVAATCRKLREQAIPIYYARNKFQFYVGNQNTQALAKMLQSFFQVIGRQTARYIKHIIWADVNDPTAFEEVLSVHAMQELSGVKTIKFIRLPTKTIQCRRVAPASQKEATPAFQAMKHYLDTRQLLRNICAKIKVVFPQFPAKDVKNPPVHDAKACEQCRRHKKFFQKIESWFHRMQKSKKPSVYPLYHEKSPQWHKLLDDVREEMPTAHAYELDVKIKEGKFKMRGTEVMATPIRRLIRKPKGRSKGKKTGTMTGGRVGTMTGGRVGTMTGGRVGTMTGGRVGTMTGGRQGTTKVTKPRKMPTTRPRAKPRAETKGKGKSAMKPRGGKGAGDAGEVQIVKKMKKVRFA